MRLGIAIWVPVMLLSGCLSLRARTERLAEIHIHRADRLLQKDAAKHADEVLIVYSRFLLHLHPLPALDPVRARILEKRGQVYVIKGRKDLAEADFDTAHRLRGPSKSGLPTRPVDPEEVRKRYDRGGLFQAVTASFDASPGRRGRVSNRLGCWGALPVSGMFRRDSSRVEGTALSLGEDFGLEDPLAVPFVAIDFEVTDRFAVCFRMQGAGFSGTALLEKPARYDGATFEAGEAVSGDFRLLDAGLLARTTPLVRGGSRLSLEAGFRYLELRVRLRSPAVFKEDALDAFLPSVGITLEHALRERRLRLVVEVRACLWQWEQGILQVRSTVLGAQIALEFAVMEHLALTLGARGEYASYTLSWDGEEKILELGFVGPWLGISLRL